MDQPRVMLAYSVGSIGGDLAQSLWGGDWKTFPGPKYRNDLFRKKSSCRKFL